MSIATKPLVNFEIRPGNQPPPPPGSTARKTVGGFGALYRFSRPGAILAVGEWRSAVGRFGALGAFDVKGTASQNMFEHVFRMWFKVSDFSDMNLGITFDLITFDLITFDLIMIDLTF